MGGTSMLGAVRGKHDPQEQERTDGICGMYGAGGIHRKEPGGIHRSDHGGNQGLWGIFGSWEGLVGSGGSWDLQGCSQWDQWLLES